MTRPDPAPGAHPRTSNGSGSGEASADVARGEPAAPGPDALADYLVDCYAALEETTRRLMAAVEADDSDATDSLIEARDAQLAAASAVIQQLVPQMQRISPARREAVLSQAEATVRRDDLLRATASSRSHSLPQQLAEVRQALAALGRYGLSAPDAPSLFDRRG